jgi:retron-type reverse transcriptase
MVVDGRQHWQPRRGRARPPAVERPVKFQPGELIALAPISHPENLLATMNLMAAKGGPGPGLDGIRLRDLGPSERAIAARQLSRQIKLRTYCPGPARRKEIPKPDGGTRTLSIRSVFDRTVSKAVMLALLHYLDTAMWPGSMGFRPKRGVLKLLAELELAIRMGKCVIVHVDVRKAFDNVLLALAVDAFRQHVADEEVMWLVETVLRGYEGTARHISIDQGDPLSALALNILLTHVLDWPLRAACPDILFWRYADNIVIACQNMTVGRHAVHTVDQLLTPTGLSLKEEHGLTNLQRQGTRLRLLGHEISLRADGTPCYGISQGSWHHLANQLMDAHSRPDPQGMANEIVQSWLSGYGPAYEFAVANEILDGVYRTAARYGYREIEPIDKLLETMDMAQRRWSTIRETASLGYQGIQQQDTESVSDIQEIDALHASCSDGCPFDPDDVQPC